MQPGFSIPHCPATPSAAPTVKLVAPGFLGERVHQQSAPRRRTWYHEPPNGVEVFLRLIFVPRGGASREDLQISVASAGPAVTDVAPCVAWLLVQENRLHAGLEVVVVERHGRRGWRRLLNEQRDQRDEHGQE